MVPLQVVWRHMSQRHASGTSLAAILPIALVGSAAYYFGPGGPQLDLNVALLVVVGGMAGVFGGAQLADRVPEHALKIVVALLLVAAGAKELHDGIVGVSGAPLAGVGPAGTLRAVMLVLAGVAVGVLSGLTGVGGGVLLVPLLVIGFGVGHRVAQGTSLLAIIPNSVIGTVVHQRHGDVDVGAATRIGLAGVPAAVVGAVLALWLPQRLLAAMFGLFLLLAAVLLWPRRSQPEELGPTRPA